MAREKDEWLVCDELGRGRRCGGRIGFIQDADGQRLLLILPGWLRDKSRVYHEPPNAWDRRQRRGYPPRPLPGRLSGVKRGRGPSWSAASFDPTGNRWVVKVRCSDCQHTHDLTADELGVEPIAPYSLNTESAHKSP